MKRELALAFGMVRKEKRIVPIVSIVFKKNKRAKNNPLVLLFIFCFLRFLYNRLFPIRLVFLIVFYILAFPNYIGFSNCILYIGFFQLYWFFPIVFYILAFPNYIVFSPIVFIQLP